MNRNEYEARVWEVATLIKLVASYNPRKICRIAENIKNIYEGEYDNIDNLTLFQAYTMEIKE